MNPSRYARVLALSIASLTVPLALRAQTPCESKQNYDAAKAVADAADTALVRFARKQGKPSAKRPGDKAKLGADLSKAQADTLTTNQVLRDAEQALLDKKKDSVDFATGRDKGQRLAELTTLIAAHQKKIDDIKKERDGKKTTIKSIDDAKTLSTEAEAGLKKQVPGLPLVDLDDAKQRVDADVAKLAKAVQAQQASASGIVSKMTQGGSVKADANSTSPTTELQCPEVAAVQQVIGRKNRALQLAVTNYETVDQNNSNAAGMRSEFAKKAKEIEDGLVADQATLLAAAQACQQTVKNNMDDLDKKRSALEKLDPGGTLRQQEEDLKKLEADTDLAKEKARLSSEQTVANTQVRSARTNLTTSKAAKAAADADVEELEKNLEVSAGADTVSKVQGPYDAAVAQKDIEVARANQDLAAAKTYLDDLSAIKKDASAYKQRKQAFKTAAAAWNARNAKAGKDAAEARLVQAEKEKLVTEKTALVQEKTRLKALLKARNISLDSAKICDRKKELRDALLNRKVDLDQYKCFTDAATAIGLIDTRAKLLASVIRQPRQSSAGIWRLASWTATPRPVHRRLGPLSRPALLEALECSLADLALEEDLAELNEEIVLEESVTEEPTDSVPGDLAKNTDEVKVPRYYVFLLTNASNGLYVGDEDGLKKMVRCGFVGGGIGCKPTDLITYKKLHGPFPTQEEAQSALCQSITETRYFPIGIGLKGRWQGGTTWYGLWDASVSGCPKQ